MLLQFVSALGTHKDGVTYSNREHGVIGKGAAWVKEREVRACYVVVLVH